MCSSDLLNTIAIIPENAGVANAVGAVVGEVRVKVVAHVSHPEEQRFRVMVGAQVKDFSSETEAMSFAEITASALAMSQSTEAGASDAHVDVSYDIKTATIEDTRKFIEATISAVAHGRPRLGG